jgi:hypothetical protein
LKRRPVNAKFVSYIIKLSNEFKSYIYINKGRAKTYR